MNARLIQLAERRATLVARAEAQRNDIARAAVPWSIGLSFVDRALEGIRYLKENPVLVAGAVAVLAVFRPRRALVWLRRGWVAWRTVNAVKRRLNAFF